MSLKLLKNHQAKLEHHKRAKKQVRVPFTRWQYETVHAFLNQMRESGKVEEELGAPIKVEIDWSEHNELKYPHVFFQGPKGHKSIPLRLILEAALPKEQGEEPSESYERN